MSSSQRPFDLTKITAALSSQSPFSSLSSDDRSKLFLTSRIVECKIGERILRLDSIPSYVYLVIKGRVRLLAKDQSGSLTLDCRGSGQLFGWVSLLCGEGIEWVIASEDTHLLEISAQEFVQLFLNNSSFQAYFSSLRNAHETYRVGKAIFEASARQEENWMENFWPAQKKNWLCSVMPEEPFKVPHDAPKDITWHVSTGTIPGISLGRQISEGEMLPRLEGYNLPYRCIGLLDQNKQIKELSSTLQLTSVEALESRPDLSLQELGILESDNLSDEERFPYVKGNNTLDEAMAACEMASLYLKVPFRKELVRKVLEGQFQRDKVISLQLIGRLLEMLGLNCQIGNTKSKYIAGTEVPILLFYKNTLAIIYQVKSSIIVMGIPNKGILNVTLDTFLQEIGDEIEFLLPKRVGSTPFSRFGWSWFIPLVKKYKSSLFLVFFASLLAQLFGLAIPLLIQQIIDKVLSQGNISTLNVLGALMIVLALFRGILTALRTYIFVDTTDRMDLTLGTAVIGRLLSLPMKFFDRRPVGELSQRIGELNTIRSFLTGTALVSVLDIIFALLYLVVMIVYSPLLTAVALSTLPLYFLLVFGIAPIYKSLIRKRAVASAKTQSHLIEVLTGIQTVKAQHFELTARWKWQDRYRHFVDEGFKSTVLGSTSGEIGSFLNQVSSLMVLWIGMLLVLDGELTLGMLIAFRIISGNVTGPLLRLSKLYQSFQGVQLSMERLGDVLDQNPELSSEEDLKQIALPAIQGAIRFENVKFRFGKSGPFQVDNVSFSITEGQFVGIVGQSGSGKSTLTKLIPRLYALDEGSIYIDNFNIAKISLTTLRNQVGIVPQDSLLFEGTIAENIALNDPQADDETIINAAKIACAHEFIMGLDLGYATKLSERGGNLSGGQRQRIAIARTILSNPQLLIMDEATSALDYSTERRLCINLQEWASGRTVLFITHRLSTIKNSDQILVMNAGILAEAGTHSELLEKNQRYATLYNQQSNS